MHPRTPLAIILTLMPPALACLSAAGCSSSSTSTVSMRSTNPAHPTRPARISHVVLFKLHDPGLTDDMLADCDALLPAIPGVISYASGMHLDTGRETVDGDYHGALYVGFMTESGYAAYVDHPNHVELVTKWRPHLEWLRVHDVLDETP